MSTSFLNAAVVVAAMGLSACSSGPAKTTETKTDAGTAPKREPAGPPQPIAAKTAFYKMYTPAHAWAADLVSISLKSGEVAGVTNADGKAGVWTAVFASPSQRAVRTYVYSVADQLPDISKGVKAQPAEPWSGPTNAVMTFQTADFNIDSEAAYQTATAKAADWLKIKDNAEKPISLSLGAASRFQAPAVWVVFFGSQKSGYVSVIDASNGKVVGK
jgi:hypothetical protein